MPGGGGSGYVSGDPGSVTRRRFATYSLLLNHLTKDCFGQIVDVVLSGEPGATVYPNAPV